MTLTQIAKHCRYLWLAWAHADDAKEGLPCDMSRQWVDWHIALCDAVIESEVRREEHELLKEVVRLCDIAARQFDSAKCADMVVEAFEWLDQQRANREGPQS